MTGTDTAVTRRAGVLGRPIAHSLSPVIHNAGFAAAGLSGWAYAAHDCGEADLAGFVAELGPEWVGMSLTMPLKEVALAVADETAPLAAAIGAANTLVRRPDGGWRAENTDAPGMVDALHAAGAGTARRVAVLGAGGTARAAVAASRDLGAEEVTVYARRPEAVADLEALGKGLGVAVVGAPWADAAPWSARGAGGREGVDGDRVGAVPRDGGRGPADSDAIRGAGGADVLISTVPKGVADPLAGLLAWRAGAVLFDAIYDPWPTPLAAAAQAAGVHVVSGLDLLLAQAVRQFELFTGVPAPVTAMRDALATAASRRR